MGKIKPGYVKPVDCVKTSKDYLFTIVLSEDSVKSNWNIINDYFMDRGTSYKDPEIFINCCKERAVLFYGAKIEICHGIFRPKVAPGLLTDKVFDLLRV